VSELAAAVRTEQARSDAQRTRALALRDRIACAAIEVAEIRCALAAAPAVRAVAPAAAAPPAHPAACNRPGPCALFASERPLPRAAVRVTASLVRGGSAGPVRLPAMRAFRAAAAARLGCPEDAVRWLWDSERYPDLMRGGLVSSNMSSAGKGWGGEVGAEARRG